ncbi:MAG: vWA domain-containing protein, partial [Vicinamibacteria bacterium]
MPKLLPKAGEAVILLILDNSASLPPLDPELQRREAIEKIYAFLRGQPYRLVLFGGRKEVHVDAPQEYRNSGQWTDFVFAFEAARELIKTYPEGTEFKMVLITDGKLDPSPEDWTDRNVPAGADLKSVAGDRAIGVLEEMGQPLYVILIGNELDLELIQRMVIAANGGIAANEYAQGIADFFADDGMLLRRFIFRIEEDEGIEEIEPIVTRIATPATPKVEFAIVSSLLVVVGILIGVGVRSFPGAGDREVIELRTGESLQVAVDRLRRLSSDVPAWSWKGLSLVESSRNAVAMLTAYKDSTALPPIGFPLDGLDGTSRELIALPLPALGERLAQL